jgi:UDP-3-O-[3-hydroxymyristoyl] glucosamine N-acyltransferase
MTLREVADLVGGTVEGDASTVIDGIAAVESAGPSDLTFAADQRHGARIAESKAGAAIVGRSPASAPMPLVRVGDVQAAVAKLLGHVGEMEDFPPVGVHPTAVVSPRAQVAPDARIGPGAVVGDRSSIGPGCILCAHVAVNSDVALGRDCVLFEGVVVKPGCAIGDRVRIGPNSVIGHDGFGYRTEGGVHHRIPHVGNVVIEDDVDIGACACVDRAKFGSTRIGAGTKIDNLVQVAHNVQVGRGCILVGQCGIAGSAKLGQYVVVGGNAGIRDNITLGDGVHCSAFAAVAADVPDGQAVAGIPAAPARDMYRQLQAAAKLPELLKRVKELEARLSALESAKDH